MTTVHRGQCLCGQVVFEAGRIEPKMAHCHCSMCRKFHGAAFATYASVPEAQFRWLSGEQLLKAWEEPGGTRRHFCRNCGSSMTFFSPRTTLGCVEIAVALLDEAPSEQPDANIFTENTPSWWRDAPSLPTFSGGRDTPAVQVARGLHQIALLVDDYDEAIEFFVGVLNFKLVEDTPIPEEHKRWVVVQPAGHGGAGIVLSRPRNEQQRAAIGNQGGGRVFAFVETDDFDRDYRNLCDQGVAIVKEPRSMPYGTVCVFADLYGNLWDLIQRRSDAD